MSSRPANPRELREAQARFAYDLRNKGVDRAVTEMQARNAVRRDSDRRTVERATRDLIDDNIGKELEARRRGTVHFVPK